MKRTANRFKRLIVLLCLTVAMVFGGCGVEPQPVAAHPAVGELSSKKATEIRQAYYEENYVHGVYTGKIEIIRIIEYFGNFHGCELILLIDYNLHKAASDPATFDTTEENIVYHVYDFYGLIVYLEPEVYPDVENNVLYISTAYEQGYFTKEDIEEWDKKYTIYDVENAYTKDRHEYYPS